MSKEKYSSGWRPELSLKQVALDMIEIIFDESASVEECQMAANTLVEAVYPELFKNITCDLICPECGAKDIYVFSDYWNKCMYCGSFVDPV